MAWTHEHGWTTADGNWMWNEQLCWLYPLDGGGWFYSQEGRNGLYFWGSGETYVRWSYDATTQKWLKEPCSFAD